MAPAGPGQPQRRLGTHTDLTLLKQAEQDRAHLLARLERAEVIANMGSWEHDLHTGRVWWSPQMHALVGSTPQEAPVSDLRHLHPDDRAEAQACAGRAR